MTDSIADDLLRNGFERWQRLEGEKQAISEDLKELFKELKAHGFDGKALRVAFRRVAKVDDLEAQELEAVVELYVNSLTGVGTQILASPATHATRVESKGKFRREDLQWQAPRMASMLDQRDARRAGTPISQDFTYHDGFVYFIEFPELGELKIGLSNNVEQRLADLSKERKSQGSILHSMPGNRQAEMVQHEHFAAYRTNGEWFALNSDTRRLVNDLKAREAA